MQQQNNNTYNQPPMGQEMPQYPRMPMQYRMRRGMQNATEKIKSIFPKWLPQYAVVVYLITLFLISLVYSELSLPWYYMLSGVVAILVFFLYGQYLSERFSLMKVRRERVFEQRIFVIALLLRMVWVILIYTIFMQSYGDPFGFEHGDAEYYDYLGQHVANLIRQGNFHFYDEISKWSGSSDVADMGYGIYVGFIYWLTGSSEVVRSYGEGASEGSIIALRLIKCIWSAITVLLLYRLAKRNFGEQTGRIVAIFFTLWPNFWYYCGAHLKETEMVFLCVLFVEQADQMLKSRLFTAWKVIPVLLIAAAIFTVRTPLGIVALLALIFSVVMSSQRVMTWGKRIIVGVLAVLLIGVVAGEQLQERANDLVSQVQEGGQDKANEWRTRRANGNTFAKYAGASVFAPMIFTLPFPTMVKPFEGQNVQQLLNGGNFTKNILSFFTIVAIISLLLTGKWRDHLLPLSFMLGYLIVLTMSAFAHSERFHQPAMPFEMMFAVYGLSVAVTKPKYKRWFTYWCVLMFVAAIAWNWFKLKGRGLG